MKTVFVHVLLFLFVSTGDFKSAQLKHDRVKTAYEEKEESLRQLYREKGVDFLSSAIFIRVLKKEKELELWVKNRTGTYILIKKYTICSASGTPGPKRKLGDDQVPEGFYQVDRFNPYSSFHLSLGLNYPNASDKILSDPQQPGGNIFIHGNCMSIGCMAMTDDKIKEIYIAAVEAMNGGQTRIPVHIYPFRMTAENMSVFLENYEGNETLLSFWKNIQTGYEYFEKNKKLPLVSVDKKGNYQFK